MPLARHRFTVDEYHRMGQAGIFAEDDRVELIDGEIVEMTPIGPGHAGAVDELVRLFTQLGGDEVTVRAQNPILLDAHAAPQPDVAVVRRKPQGYRSEHPGPDDTLLVIEVADTSVHYDRSTKIPLYARAAIPEAWLVNLSAETIEVCRDPGSHGYASMRTVGRGAVLAPLKLPHVTLRTDDILG